MKLGVIGCGNMGGGMVAHLLEMGLSVLCYDPAHDNLERMAQLGADMAASAADLARKCDRIILSLPKAAVIEFVMDEIVSHLTSGTIVLDTSTSEPEISQKMATIAASQKCHFVDGPVSGGPIAARNGTMTMLLGGDQGAIDALRPLTDILTAKTVVVGGPGAGHAAKIANNMLCAANLVLVAEAVRLGQAAGVAPADLLEGINAGSGRSGVSEVNFPKWVLTDAFDSGFTMGLMRKDVGLALDLAKAKGVALDGFASIADLWLTKSQNISDAADFNEITKLDGGRNQ
ncbi:NAD(P)-dependent oxidoreductase [Litoreibacter janthinus]|uniref:3-hydroxyisobutyrate dehydrogenase n=1 Tax=Litoreibacter janthinus TaxID=670154 RepID=A0A1I6G4U1_9RHOB|nr:NAD(P)-dependent oxidoreductase [Litoreibacter janthinus]SFR37215.1 3-hydroxyisobutyrate dehydrogenase [Litoreibacter janthinus]